MRLTPARIVLLWLLAMLAGAGLIARSRLVADMSFFLPSQPTSEQRVLVGQMSEGSISRMLMLGVAGGTEQQRAQASMALRRALADSGLFVSVQNGEMDGLEAERDALLRWRYHLSPAVTPQRFTEEGLRDAVDRAVDLVASPVGYLFKPYLLRDPTGEMVEVLQRLHAGGQPQVRGGVWASPDGRRALLLAQTRAAGSNTDGQEQAIQAVRAAFAAARDAGGAPDLQLALSGPGFFAVQSRDTVRAEISRTSALGMLGIVLVLGWVYRSARTLALGLLPVVTGAVAGVVVVGLVYGNVHGITVGFGAALIGEAVDYAIYFCVQSGRYGMQAWRRTFWPTIRLGVLTSIVGFGALLLAGFPGLAQLGLYALSGVATAALVTRFVLPALVGERGVQVPPPGAFSRATQGALAHARVLRWPLLVLAAAAALYLTSQHARLWSTNLSALSMVNAQDALVDARLRTDLGAPDARYLVLVRGPDAEVALERAEEAGARLQELVGQGAIGGFDSPARFLPSQRTQRQRLAALPARAELQTRLQRALADAPLSAARLGAFVDDVQAARAGPLLTRADLDGTALALAVDSLLARGEEGWSVVMPLHPVSRSDDAEMPVAALRQALADTGAVVIDLKGEFERMYDSYLGQAVWLSLGGVLAITALLAFSLRSGVRLARVLLTQAVTVALVMAGLHLAGLRLHLLHLVGLLLVVAVGSNYALFFDRIQADGELAPDVWLSMSVAVLTTAIGFGVLAISRVPVLQALGITVAPGVLLAMVVSAALILGRDRKG